MREQGLGLLQALADLDGIGMILQVCCLILFISADALRRTFSDGCIHFDSRLFGSFNYSIRKRASDGEGLVINLSPMNGF